MNLHGYTSNAMSNAGTAVRHKREIMVHGPASEALPEPVSSVPGSLRRGRVQTYSESHLCCEKLAPGGWSSVPSGFPGGLQEPLHGRAASAVSISRPVF